jgi:DNA-binding NarL/FixJ family response regulator
VTGSDHLRVLICDDAVAFPRLVELWLDGDKGVAPVGVVATADELLATIGETAPDVLLLDLMLPHGPATPELVAQVRAKAPGVRIVLVSNLPHDALAEAATRLGAEGFCSKATTPELLIEAVRGA